jgi:hypothetical protein
VSGSRQQHRCRRTGASGADDDHVGRNVLARGFPPSGDQLDLVGVFVHGHDDAGPPPARAWNRRGRILETRGLATGGAVRYARPLV